MKHYFQRLVYWEKRGTPKAPRNGTVFGGEMFAFFWYTKGLLLKVPCLCKIASFEQKKHTKWNENITDELHASYPVDPPCYILVIKKCFFLTHTKETKLKVACLCKIIYLYKNNTQNVTKTSLAGCTLPIPAIFGV